MDKTVKTQRPTARQLFRRASYNLMAIGAVAAIFAAKAVEAEQIAESAAIELAAKDLPQAGH